MKKAALLASCAILAAGGALLSRPSPLPAQDSLQVAAASPLLGRDIATYALIRSLAGPDLGGDRRGTGADTSCLRRDAHGSLVQLARCSLLPEEPTPVPGEPTTGEGPTAPEKPPATGGGSHTDPAQAGFAYYPPGDLFERDTGRGRADRYVYMPDIIFPLKLGDGLFPHMNSQIWGYGGGGYGGKGAAGGSENDPRNFDPMKQRDNYCEIRSWDMPLCPGGAGHQGQDIRPPSWKDNHWEVVAVADGQIVNVTTNTTVQLKANDGTDYYYLHMHPKSITVKTGAKVKQGQVLGKVSRYMGGKVGTSLHLHLQVRQRVRVGDKTLQVYVPTFPSLIAALRRAKGLDPGIDADGNLMVDAGLEIGAPQPPPAPEPQPEPAPVPEPEPTPQPEPGPTPDPTPTPEPEPAPQPEPAPAPEPAPEPQPEPTPAPEPEPTPAPTPEPGPSPQPEPAPQPDPAPVPDPEPQPAPAPAPAPDPAEQGWWDWIKDKWNSWWQ